MSAPAIVDAHVHLWNPAQLRHAWLDGVPALNRAFLPADYAAASATAGVCKFIFVEGGCAPGQNLAEVDWAASLAKSDPRLQGIIAQVSLEQGEAVRTALEKLAHQPLVKGVRRILQGKTDADFCRRPGFLAGVKQLAEFGFTCDLCIRPEQLRDVTELVRRVPQVTFVLDHFGKPDVCSRRTEPWAADLKLLAALPNIFCKISGLTTEADCQNWTRADLKCYFDHALECFGADRVLFGSDWPVATLATDYERWVETVRSFLASAGAVAQNQLFLTNAERIYRV